MIVETPDFSLNMMEVEGNHREVKMEIHSLHRPSWNLAIKQTPLIRRLSNVAYSDEETETEWG